MEEKGTGDVLSLSHVASGPWLSAQRRAETVASAAGGSARLGEGLEVVHRRRHSAQRDSAAIMARSLPLRKDALPPIADSRRGSPQLYASGGADLTTMP
jgi:hypothetical protein